MVPFSFFITISTIFLTYNCVLCEFRILSIRPPLTRTGRARFQQDNDEMCVDKCYASISNETNIETSGSLPLLHQKRFTENELLKECRLANSIRSCGNACSESVYKNYLLKGLSATTYICNETDFLQRSPCYLNAMIETKSLCYNGKCRKQLENYNASYTNYNIGIFMDCTCDHIRCNLDCMREKIIQKCSLEGFQIFKTFFQKWVNSFKEQTDALNEHHYNEPNSCLRFRSEEDDD